MKDNMIHKIYEVVNHILQVDPEFPSSTPNPVFPGF